MGYELECNDYDADLRLIFLDHKRVCMLVDREDIFETNWEAVSYRGECYYQLGRYQEALTDFQQTIHLDGTDANQYNDRGRAYQGLGIVQNAIEDYVKTIEMEPEHPYVWGHLGEVYIQEGKWEKAAEAMNITGIDSIQ